VDVKPHLLYGIFVFTLASLDADKQMELGRAGALAANKP